MAQYSYFEVAEIFGDTEHATPCVVDLGQGIHVATKEMLFKEVLKEWYSDSVWTNDDEDEIETSFGSICYYNELYPISAQEFKVMCKHLGNMAATVRPILEKILDK